MRFAYLVRHNRMQERLKFVPRAFRVWKTYYPKHIPVEINGIKPQFFSPGDVLFVDQKDWEELLEIVKLVEENGTEIKLDEVSVQ